ncbi:DUF5675 family protein [Alteromonas sp. RKMC-009]|uniref:DUF5675 family protein n=1 Tax=Alteromonas sp. RKMC-009 TaxID=2267264 RepID=UPI000E67E416|nr:DUF5675 family protein [Alteromonas sp. RKMC-009]AYA64321.1 hypothetical protein DS731_10100 [Alteromonas sp. RKMC-009]
MLTLYRKYFPDRTESELTMPDGTKICFLERPDLNNIPFKSCIPEGVYIVDRDYTGQHQFYRLRDVEGRTDIEIHLANYVHQLAGCLAPCMKIVDGVGINSEAAMDILLEWFGDSSWILEITHELD